MHVCVRLLQEENLSEQSLRRDLLRKAYHRVIQMAIKGVDEFWKEYCDFERAESQPTLVRGASSVPVLAERRVGVCAWIWSPLCV